MKKSSQSVGLKEGAMSSYSCPGNQSIHPCSLDPEGHPQPPPATPQPSCQHLPHHLSPPAQGKAGGPPGCPCWRRFPRTAHSFPSMHCEPSVCVLFCYRGIPGSVSLDCNINIVQLLGSLIPIMVILQVTMRKIFLIVSGYILLQLICILEKEKFS